MQKWKDKLKNPPVENRGIPFWSWNGKLESEMLRWQIREMKKVGLGGGFMHAREGLLTEYMGKEWMDCVEACIDEGKRVGIKAWCYDEQGWPSGFGGGAVNGLGEDYYERHLTIEETTEFNGTQRDALVVGVYRYKPATGQVIWEKETDNMLHANEDEMLLVIRQKLNPYYVDILNEKVVKAFIDSTYEKYYERFADEFGSGMPGFFTDEPQYSKNNIPWSLVFPEKFSYKYGYEIFSLLPALFVECEGFEKFRYDFWGLTNELYVQSYGKQIFDWCNDHHCQWTGHIVQEVSLTVQMGQCAGVMPFYEYMHIPGIDWLGRKIGNPIIVKQLASVINQLGIKFALSEMFASCGWDVSFEELKWIAEWQFVNGINLMCQHLQGYTLQGQRKRDCPASLFYYQPWWKEYRIFNDYFARLSVLLSEGSQVADVLVLHPIKSAWIVYKTNEKSPKLTALDKAFEALSTTLSGYHVDYHYGDETLIAKYGYVDNGQLVIGQCRYKTVVLPHMLTIDSTTLRLLLDFAAQGGKIFAAGQLPYLLDGEKSHALERLEKCVHKVEVRGEVLRKALTDLKAASISIEDENGQIDSIAYQQRNIGDTQVYFIVNHSQTATFNAKVTLPGEGHVERFELETGETQALAGVTADNGQTTFSLTFLPMQSFVIFRTQGKKVATDETYEKQFVTLGSQWDVQDADLNSLTLDYCYYKVDDGEWQGPESLLRLTYKLIKLKRSCKLALKLNFNIADDFDINRELFLAMEEPEKFDIWLNGYPITYKDTGFWKEASFKKVEIKPFIHTGINEIILERDFYQEQKIYDVLFAEDMFESEINKLTYTTELESLYIVGDFAVVSQSEYTKGDRGAIFTDGPFKIVNPVHKVQTGDLIQQGYCFFAGALTIAQDLKLQKEADKRLVIDLKKPYAVISKVSVNGKEVAVLPWAPYEADITDAVHDGVNNIAITLYSSNRNLLGPHHHKDGQLHSTPRRNFVDAKAWLYDAKNTFWVDRYCFVKFGLEE